MAMNFDSLLLHLLTSEVRDWQITSARLIGHFKLADLYQGQGWYTF